MTSKSIEEIKALTTLRFIAALYVFVFHIHIRWPITSDKFLHSFLSQGAVGMSIFFMLSGYILAYRYGNEIINLKEYAINRFAKIYPVYVAAALITIPWIGISFTDNTTSQALLQLGTLITADILVIQAWFSPLFHYWNNGASWSISVEFFLYAMFPVVMYLLRNKPLKSLIFVVGVAYILSMLPGFVHMAYPDGTSYFYSLPLFRLSEFTIGVAAFLLTKHIKFNTKALDLTLLAAIVLLTVYLGFFGQKMPLYIAHNWIAIPVITLALVVLANKNTRSARLMSINVGVWLGKISYCFYSFQAFFILLMLNNKELIKQEIPLFNNHIILLICVLAALTLVSWLGYIGIEEPMRKWIRNKYTPKSNKIVV